MVAPHPEQVLSLLEQVTENKSLNQNDDMVIDEISKFQPGLSIKDVGCIYASYPQYKSNILQNLFKSFKLLSTHSKYSKILDRKSVV